MVQTPISGVFILQTQAVVVACYKWWPLSLVLPDHSLLRTLTYSFHDVRTGQALCLGSESEGTERQKEPSCASCRKSPMKPDHQTYNPW